MPIHVITGIGPDGRSCVISKAEKILGAPQAAGLIADDTSIHANDHSAPVRIANLYQTDPAPRVERPAKGTLLPIALQRGAAMWLELKFEGATDQSFHRTDTIDFQHILSGEVELLLEDGSVRLSAGDSAVIPGVVHGWRSRTGWSSSLIVIGIEPP